MSQPAVAASRAARTPADDARSLRTGARRRRRVAGGGRAGRRGLVRRARQLVGARARARREGRRSRSSATSTRSPSSSRISATTGSRRCARSSGWDPAVMVGAARRRPHPRRRGSRAWSPRSSRSAGEARSASRSSRTISSSTSARRTATSSRSLVRPGDDVVWHGAPLRCTAIASRRAPSTTGWAATSRSRSARRIAEDGGAPGDVIAVAAVQEEVGDFAGSRTAAFATEPDSPIAIDVTHTTDVRGADPEDEGKVDLGGGPTISRGPSIHEDVFELLYDTAEAEGIPFVGRGLAAGTTSPTPMPSTSAVAGVPTGLVSVPLRYMHSPIEIARPRRPRARGAARRGLRAQARARDELRGLSWIREPQRHRLRRADAVREAQRRPRRAPRDRARRDRDPGRARARRTRGRARSTT